MILIPYASRIEYAHGSNRPARNRNRASRPLPLKLLRSIRTFPNIIRHRNSSAVRLQRAARTCIGAMCFSRMARDRNATPHPMETIAMRKIVNSNLLSRIYHVPPPRF